eukprot:TRINITY_DN826_c0_g2_i1.p1 TRINITY_DN826_c0_g2~~TRINITY_DN826_c0_g2_i1.p1  ORF type:complete len:909 (-),score=203.01 TRINITY_DN826_c0_g2_i1:292-3018(-)
MDRGSRGMSLLCPLATDADSPGTDGASPDSPEDLGISIRNATNLRTKSKFMQAERQRPWKRMLCCLENLGSQGFPRQFRFALGMSTRVAFWVMLIAAPPLFANIWAEDGKGGRARMIAMGLPIATIVMNFLFTVGKNFGETVQNTIGGTAGSFWSLLIISFLNNQFPHGYNCVPAGSPIDNMCQDAGAIANGLDRYQRGCPCTADDDRAWWAIAALSAVYIACFLFLNVLGNVRFFALMNYISHMMCMLNPTKVDVATSAKTELKLFMLSAIIAMVCTLLPWPIFALHRAQNRTNLAMAKSFELLRRFVDYYSGDKPSLMVYELQHELDDVKSELAGAKSYMDAAWYESAGCSSRLGLTTDTIAMMDQMVKLIEPLLSVACKETFDGSHRNIMSEVTPLLRDALDDIEELASTVANSAMAGQGQVVEDRSELWEAAEALRNSIEPLSHAVKTACLHSSGLPVSDEVMGEHHLGYTFYRLAAVALGRTEALIEGKVQQTPWWEAPTRRFKQLFTGIVGDHFWWALRNTIALYFCLYIGYAGSPYCDMSEKDADCFMRRYSTGPACIVILLMTTAQASTMKAAITRVAAVVLAAIAGRLGWVFFGWCGSVYSAMTAVAVFFLVQPMMYVSYVGGDSSAIAMRLAAIGATFMLQPCSDTTTSYKGYADEYHGLIDEVVGVFVMLFVDMLLGDRPSSVQARKLLTEAMSQFKETFDSYVSTQKSQEELFTDIADIQSKIDAATALSADAANEPLLWRQPWRPALVAEISTEMSKLCSLLHNLGDQVGVEFSHLLLFGLRNFKGVRSELTDGVGYAMDLSTFVLNEASLTSSRHLTWLMSPHAASGEIASLPKLLQEMNAADLAVDSPTTKKGTKELEHISISSQQCVVVCTLAAIMDTLQRMQKQVVMQKTV